MLISLRDRRLATLPSTHGGYLQPIGRDNLRKGYYPRTDGSDSYFSDSNRTECGIMHVITSLDKPAVCDADKIRTRSGFSAMLNISDLYLQTQIYVRCVH